MSFVPRYTPPDASNKYYINTGYGGLNPCITPVSSPMVLPNCVGYAFGRFYEILGSSPTLSRGDAGTWYSNTYDGYQRSTTPKVGSVVCWCKPGSYGHVAIIEKVNSDKSIVISQSAYRAQYYDPTNSKHFWTETVYPPYNIGSISGWLQSYVFQGFIHNPATENESSVSPDSPSTPSASSSSSDVSPNIETALPMVSAAQNHVGENGEWTWSTVNIVKGQPWNTSFIMALAKSVSGCSRIIPYVSAAYDIPKIGVLLNLGSWIVGPNRGETVVPKSGDLIFLLTSPKISDDKYYSNRVGIVKSVYQNTINVIEGDCGSADTFNSKVAVKQYRTDFTSIVGYYRPKWDLIGENYYADSSLSFVYSSDTTRNDAVVREVGYMNSSNKPSIHPSDTKLSVINYTSMLSSVISVINASVNSESLSKNRKSFNVILKLSSVARAVVEFLMDNGFGVAASIGVCANIQAECDFKPGSSKTNSDGSISGGICMWQKDKYSDMIKYVGNDWRNNLSGQLKYLLNDMLIENFNYYRSKFKSTYGMNLSLDQVLKCLPDDLSGAKSGADIFARVYLNVENIESASIKRQNIASSLWKNVTLQLV